MKLLGKKALVLLLCVPAYPFVIFAEWYDKATHFYSTKFNLRKATAEYWSEIWEVLTYKDGD